MTMQAWSPDPGGANYGSSRNFCGSFRNFLIELNAGPLTMNVDEKQRGTILIVREKYQIFLGGQLKRLSYCSKIDEMVQIYFSVYGNA